MPVNHQTSPLSIVESRITILTSIITLARSLTRLVLDLVTKSTTTHRQVTDMKNTMDRHRGPPQSVINNMSWVMKLIIVQPTTPDPLPTIADPWKRRTKTSKHEVRWIKCLAVARKTTSTDRVLLALHAPLNTHRKLLPNHISQPSWALKASMIQSLPLTAACWRIMPTLILCMRHLGQRLTKLTSAGATWRRASVICALTMNTNSNNKCESNRCFKPNSRPWRIRTLA